MTFADRRSNVGEFFDSMRIKTVKTNFRPLVSREPYYH